MPKKLTQEEVIRRCKKIHPEYNYDKLIYVNANTSFIVTCPIHGDFETRASREPNVVVQSVTLDL